MTAVTDVRAEDPRCLSDDPTDWPAPSRPYFMLAVDTSASMVACTTPPTAFPETCDPFAPGFALNACGFEPTRLNDAKCALYESVLAFAGQVNFGLATYAVKLTNCPEACDSTCSGSSCESDTYGCTASCFTQEKTTTGACAGCGPRVGDATTRGGAFIRVPMQVDSFWSTPSPSNVPELLSWVDGGCDGNRELYASGATPLNGMLRDLKRYFAGGWFAPDGSVSYGSPLSVSDLAGEGVHGSTACRNVNVILVTDGDETCDEQADAVAAAAELYEQGVVVGGKTFKVRTHVVNFAGGTQSNTDAIAAAGGTGSSIFAGNGGELAAALSSIVATAVQPETCNNRDDNCNGCTDEGYRHHCNLNAACCAWATETDRASCLASYAASVEANPPQGDRSLLPCTTVAQASTPSTWLCQDPGETCNGIDDNCHEGVDESQLTCGEPSHCPSPETCNGVDDDCDGQTDEDVCASCVPSVEICDGCDNDCDGTIDEPPPGGFEQVSCGLVEPPSCNGLATCKAPVQAPTPGACLAGAGYGACATSPSVETCNGLDDDCDGVIDDDFASVPCTPSEHPAGLVYGGDSPCERGATTCVDGAVKCVGGVGPTTELCDGIDNDCDGTIDDQVAAAGKPCGVSTPPCSPGVTACEGGKLVCSGGVKPTAEVCDGLDNDCDGELDEAPLADSPEPGKGGCWNEPGACCSFGGLSWCPPLGATCDGLGGLTNACGQGALACAGASGWTCKGAHGPTPEQCDGIDNDCDALIDEGLLPLVGQACGSDVGACIPGELVCAMGALDCAGDVGATQELCNGIDDDCDGVIDEGVPPNGPCEMPYDTSAFPGYRSGSPCKPGLLECDGAGQWVCTGGRAPEAEICNGIDDDCDGIVDELGAAPDGIDGSPNPFAPPQVNLGDACGVDVGACSPGAYACLGGSFSCVGATLPLFETCNCEDDDCDGVADELPKEGQPALCSPGKDCVSANGACQCAAPCSVGEYPCPPGQKCVSAKVQTTDETSGYCVVDLDALCGDCATKTVAADKGAPGCGPAGTDPEGCNLTPVCQCKGASGCREPCFGVECPSGQVCARFGDAAGSCVLDSCYALGCEGCDRVCHDGQCKPNPCSKESCPGQACEPDDSFDAPVCVNSCTGVTCKSGEACVKGACLPTCDPACEAGSTCDVTAPSGPVCVPSKCEASTCPDGRWCNPLTGACEDDPCSGVVCPGAETCSLGTCGVESPASSQGSSDDTNEEEVFEPFLGGRVDSSCSCQSVGASPASERGWWLVALALLAASRLGARHKSLVFGGALLVLSCKAGANSTLSRTYGASSSGSGGSGAGGNLFEAATAGGGELTLDVGQGGGDGCSFTNGGIELCDGQDNDCDGLIDEDFDFDSLLHCGSCDKSCFAELFNADPQTIECAWSGVPGEPGVCSFSACAIDYVDLDPSAPGCEYACAKAAEDDAHCNHKDDDCDGAIDEDIDFCSDAENCGECGRACSYVHGRGECSHDDPVAPCDLAHTSCHLASCIDADADGSPDYWDLDGLSSTGCEYACSITNGGVEICGDGVDNDCDGLIDAADELSQDPGIGVECFADPDGACATPMHAGLTVCVGNEVKCAGPQLLEEGAMPEVCNGIDDDCNGIIDDSPVDQGVACGVSNTFPCALGKLACADGKLECVGAIGPGVEACNGLDDDCDGIIDFAGELVPSDSTGSCEAPPPAPEGATSPCKAGSLACIGGVVVCQGAVGPQSTTDACGEDSNCDGVLDVQPDLTSDVHHCGACGNDCSGGTVHAAFTCEAGACVFVGCDAGWHDLDGDEACEYGCIPSGPEKCDGLDNDCDGEVDDGVVAPPPTKVCGVSVAATRSECSTDVVVSCVDGTWSCDFPAGVCSPSCAEAEEQCDELDNDCDGALNENVPSFGQPCASDDGLPFPGHGACRTTGTQVCDGPNSTRCSAKKANCAELPGGCEELCDGLDNDCDGSIDEPFTAKGSEPSYFVRPEVTQTGGNLFVFSFEASRPNATASSPGSGNGYVCTGDTCPPWLPPAPAGATLDSTQACSRGGRMPWFNVTPIEAEHTCDALGGHLCTLIEWQSACGAEANCSFGYAPRGDACATVASPSKYCNLLEYDFTSTFAGDQNGLLPCGSESLAACAADFSDLYGNLSPFIFDVTGNLREIVRDEATDGHRLMGGGFGTSELGATCDFTFYSVAPTYQLYDTGFRCCFDVDPRF